MPRTSTAIHEDAVNLTPAVMARATVARATNEIPTHGAQISNETGLSQPQTTKVLAAMQASGEAEQVGTAGLAETHRIVSLLAGTEQLREQATTDAHLARAMGLLEFAQRRGKSTGAAFDELLSVGHAILGDSNPGLQPAAPEETREDTIDLSPAMITRATVAWATPERPTYGTKVMDTTGLSEGGISRALAGMRENGEAAYSEGVLTDPGTKRPVIPIVGTEQLRDQVAADANLQRAMGLLSFAERRGVSPGAAFDELVRIGGTILEASDVEAQAPAELAHV